MTQISAQALDPPPAPLFHTHTTLVPPEHEPQTYIPSPSPSGMPTPSLKRPITVRAAQPTTSDAEAIISIGRPVYAATFGPTCSEADLRDYLDSTYTSPLVLAELTDPNKQFFIAVQDLLEASNSLDTVVGFVQLTKGTTEPCLGEYDDIIELQRFYIALDHHGAGVAARLMEHTLSVAKQQQYRHIWLGVYEHNHRARRFYQKYGFKSVGEHDFWVGSDRQTDIVCVRELVQE
ncbi:acyl-CoA N-acyltransferase [Naematelia encephala]|uniref:Acyl-CoA N-acyltransferase n=1 Tax=Naematelia encephala TaxID=71784 RepID=A0A1Y2AKL1_9TREE|nr:acyl-CoA N-acyltransferase [Naematelia encephala]